MQGVQNTFLCVEDTVGLKGDRYSIGVIDRTFGDVDSHEPRPQREYGEPIERNTDIPEADFSKFLKNGIPPKGTVLVSWQTQLKTELIPQSHLQLLDRALYVGDVVKRNAEEYMSGTVIGTKAMCTLFPATLFNGGQITQSTTDDLSIRSVPAEELINVHELAEGGLIVYGQWVGRIENVYDEITVKLSNNSVVVVEDPSELEYEDVTIERLSIGDTVKTKKGNLRRGRWKFGAFDPNVRPIGMVVETRTIEIDIQWLARRISPNGGSFEIEEPRTTLGPDEFESPEFYKYDASGGVATTLPLSVDGTDRYYHVTEVAVGDRVRFKDIAGAAIKYDGTHSLPNGYPQGKVNRIARTESLGYDLNAYLVMQTHTQIIVQWQDLSVTQTWSSCLLPDPNVDDEDELWPGEIVFTKEEKASSVGRTWTKTPTRVGIVQAVKGRDRIATVRWFKDPFIEFFGTDLIRPSSTGELHQEIEDVSLYDIYSFSALTRRRGDFVLVHPGSIEGISSSLSLTGPSWFGEITDLDLEGKLTVRLGAAKPVVDVKVPYESITLAYSSDMANEYLDMQDMDEDSSEDSDDEETDSDDYGEIWIEYDDADGDVSVGEEEDWSTEDEEEDEDSPMLDLEDIDHSDFSKTTPEGTSSPPMPMEKELSQPMEDTGIDPATTGRKITAAASESCAGFIVLESPPPLTHHFHHTTSALALNSVRRMAKEHRILANSLPPGIFVRTWESRLDLLRVLIIGPQDTPYEYAPFVIDFYVGPTYPHLPPEVFFHSWTNGNGAINPNLYEDGKICLSLLGTWHTDERTESWNPVKSTLLQVLVSIMGLVLVKEPYYNEAGYDIHRATTESRLSSALYTERTYFRSRGFIHHALTNELEPFREELNYLYLRQDDNAPKFLNQAIDAAERVIDNSSSDTGEGERDGLKRISLGALVMLKREVDKLKALEQVSLQS